MPPTGLRSRPPYVPISSWSVWHFAPSASSSTRSSMASNFMVEAPRSPSLPSPGCSRVRTQSCRSSSRPTRLGRALGLRLQGGRHRLVDLLQPDELHMSTDVVRDLLDILAIARRQHDPRNTGAGRRDHLLLDAADRQNEAP